MLHILSQLTHKDHRTLPYAAACLNVHVVLAVLHKSVHCGFCMRVSFWVVSMHTWNAQKASKPVMHSSFKCIAGWDIVIVQKQTSLIWWHSLWYLSAIRTVWFEIWPKPPYSKQGRKSSALHGGLSLYDATKHRQDVSSERLHKTCTLLSVGV